MYTRKKKNKLLASLGSSHLLSGWGGRDFTVPTEKSWHINSLKCYLLLGGNKLGAVNEWLKNKQGHFSMLIAHDPCSLAPAQNSNSL